MQPAPLPDLVHPSIWSGSDHSMSHITPSWGIYFILSMAWMSFRSLMLGDSPPCTQNTFSSTTAARVRQSKTSVQAFHTLRDPYFLMHSSQNPQTWVMSLDSWFPRSRVTLFLYLTLRVRSRRKVSTLSLPLSTQSPMKMQLVQGGKPPILNSSSRSSNWPWMSPQMVTGPVTLMTLLSVRIIYLASSHTFFTELSSIFSPFFRLSMTASSYFRVAINDKSVIQINLITK